MHVRFVIGTSTKNPLSPVEEELLKAELVSSPDDMLQLDFVECYDCVFTKVLAWFNHALEETKCAYIAKVDDDTYIRLIPLLNFLAKQPRDNLYFGMLFHTWATPDHLREFSLPPFDIVFQGTVRFSLLRVPTYIIDTPHIKPHSPMLF